MGVPGDLHQAIEFARRAWKIAPQDIIRLQGAEQLATLLRLQARRRQASGDPEGAIASCDEALALTDQALAVTPLGHGQRVDILNAQAGVRAARFGLRHDPADAHAAITLYTEALEACELNDHRRARMLSNLGHAYGELIPVTEASSLDQAVSLLREAVKDSRAHPVWPTAAANLAATLVQRYLLGHAEADLAEALSLSREVGAAPVASTDRRVRISAIAGEVAMHAGDPGQAAPFYRTALQLLPAMAWLGMDRPTQETHLGDASDIARDAAACHVAIGRAGGAVELLEQGRGVLWAQLLQLRQRHAELEEQHPDLASRLRDVGAGLDDVS
jgi:tetratricopeptide (TPR) repeat protein